MVVDPAGPHAKILVKLLRRNIGKPKAGCEVGVWKGGLSTHLLRSFHSLHLLMVDRYEEYNRKGSVWSNTSCPQEKFFQAMTTAARETLFAKERRVVLVGRSTEVAKHIQNESLDFVFIDAGHRWKECLQDIHAWFHKVKPGGFIAGHDYNPKKRGAVRTAVDKFIEQRPYRVEYTGRKTRIWWFIK
jgi:hypothetical protein